MFSYFRNLSTFRLLALVLLVTATGMMLYGHMSDAAARTGPDDAYRRAFYALHSGAVRFGGQLAAQRALAQTIAIQFQLTTPDHGGTKQVLKDIMGRAPRNILSVGVSLPGEDAGAGDPRIVTYISRSAPTTDEEKAPPSIFGSHHDDRMPYEAAWTLTTSSAMGGTGELAAIVSMTISMEGAEKGEAVVKADLVELKGILAQIKHNDVEEAFCVAPNGDIVWLRGSTLAYDKELGRGDAGPEAERIAEARRFVEGKGDREFIRANAGNTGWYFLATPSDPDADRRAAMPLPLFLFVFALTLMILEGAVARLWSYAVRRRDPYPAGADARPGFHGGNASFFAAAYDYLFKYRVINPDRTRLDSELRVARQIQFSLVPDRFPMHSEWREFDLHSMLEPAREVGGDFYDFFMLDSNRIVFTVGDVSGNGIPAALYMAVCRTAFRALARQSKDPGDIMTRLNELLIRDNHSDLYVTIACVIVDLPTGKCQYALAGHPPPIHYRAADGVVEFVDQPRETFAGAKQGVIYPIGEMTLGRGDALLLYSDGLPDARNKEGCDFDYQQLLQAFSACAAADTCRDLVRGVERSVKNFVGGRVQMDDLTIMAFRYWGPGGQIIGKEMCKLPKTLSAASARRRAAESGGAAKKEGDGGQNG